MKNAYDEKEIKEAKLNNKFKRDSYISSIKYLLNTAQGREVLWELLDTCGIYKSSFTGSSETYFLEGQRNIGLKLLNDIMEADPDAYLKMMKEKRSK